MNSFCSLFTLVVLLPSIAISMVDLIQIANSVVFQVCLNREFRHCGRFVPNRESSGFPPLDCEFSGRLRSKMSCFHRVCSAVVIAFRFGTQAPGFEPCLSTKHVTCLFMAVE
jgi:hypothetical protein